MAKEILLRGYQEEGIKLLRESLKKHKHVVFNAMVSYGKTIVMAYMAKNSVKKGNKVLILSHRSELMSQSGGCLDRFGLDVEYISPKHRNVPSGLCVTGMIQTMQRRLQKEEWTDYLRSVDMLLIDECHLSHVDEILLTGIFKDKWVIGFSGTPLRTGNMIQLGMFYEDIVQTMQPKDMIKLGNVIKPRTFVLDAPNLKNVDYDPRIGDFNWAQMGKVYDKPLLYKGVIDNYKKICPGKKALCFDANQKNAIKMCVEFNKSGIRSKFLVSGFKKNDEGYYLLEKHKEYTGKREDVLMDFKNGKFDVLCNASILSTGYDEPTIECVIMNRATTSITFLIQCWGRGVRLLPDGEKECFLLDFGDNTRRLGTFEENRDWSLWHQTGSKSGVAPVKECPKTEKDKFGHLGCGRLIPVSSQKCPFCGYQWLSEKEEREVELREIVDGQFQFSKMDAKQLLAYAELKGYSKYWVINMIWVNNDKQTFRKVMRDELGYKNAFIYMQIEKLEKKKRSKQNTNESKENVLFLDS